MMPDDLPPGVTMDDINGPQMPRCQECNQEFSGDGPLCEECLADQWCKEDEEHAKMMTDMQAGNWPALPKILPIETTLLDLGTIPKTTGSAL